MRGERAADFEGKVFLRCGHDFFSLLAMVTAVGLGESAARNLARLSIWVSQNRRYCSIHARASCMGCAARRQRWTRPVMLRWSRPADSRMRKCLETAGRDMAKGAASDVTVDSPRARRARMARRVGSER